MKRKMCLLVCGLLTVGALAGCGSTSDTTADSSAATTDSAETSEDTDAAEEEEKESEADEEGTDFDKSSDISVVSREDGSGTRGAFIELFGVEEKDANGEKIDYTTEEAIIANSTEIVMTTVAGDDYAIGYSSLGSLNDTVKAVWIDGAEPTAENINNGSYTIARPFNIATKGDVSEITQDFINYILSADGQAIIEDNGYIKASDAAAFESNGATGKIVIAGSSSVTPVMEKLQEAYQKVNTGAEIEIQESDSTTGMTAAMDGTCDIGMASRELKDTELDGGLTPTVIAKDGIAVIVNKNNPIEELTKDQVNSIFRGDVTTWEEVEE
ncbi:substrate-binding domain-containing protein [Roseburia hominis]|uniref:substrate-binding domain-containing protein n=1 Tax=Roseburia hominis TaxID=301301 RepID=UPI001F25748E|nr:substrate-binding domain-containing protein [Roseburia hominis]